MEPVPNSPFEPASPNERAGLELVHSHWTAGERVFHPKFGEGTITEAVERRGDQEVAIQFLRHGQKRLLASLAPLDLISDQE